MDGQCLRCEQLERERDEALLEAAFAKERLREYRQALAESGMAESLKVGPDFGGRHGTYARTD